MGTHRAAAAPRGTVPQQETLRTSHRAAPGAGAPCTCSQTRRVPSHSLLSDRERSPGAASRDAGGRASANAQVCLAEHARDESS